MNSHAGDFTFSGKPLFLANIQEPDTNKVVYPVPVDNGSPDYQFINQSPLFLKDPPNIKRDIVYDPISKQYIFTNKVGNFSYTTPVYMDQKEYLNYQNKKGIQKYWNDRAVNTTTETSNSIIPAIYVGGKAFDRIFGSNTIDIRPQGSAEVTFGVRSQYREDPQLDVRRRRTTNFEFDQKIQMNVIAKIGDKIEFKTNYNTEATFQFENKLSLKYEGKEDEIIKLIEAGNVSMPLNTTLISGSQALMGIKTKLQFGSTTITTIFSQQESESKSISVQGGAQTNKFKLSSLDYEENRHFFLSHYFREQYESSLDKLPVITSDINITKVEVWVTNIGPAVENNRNIVAFTDLGEGKREWLNNTQIQATYGPPIPNNLSNNLMTRIDTNGIRGISTVTAYLSDDPFHIGKSGYLVGGQDFGIIENARKLSPSEYTFNGKLGFISLNTNLNSDQTLAVAYQYTVIGYDSSFQVGEFSDRGVSAPKNLVVKLLKSSTLNTKMPMWDLMMKNVYSIRAFQVNKEDFVFNILFSGNENGVPTGYFTEGSEAVKGIPLVHLLNLDNLNQQNNPVKGGDGVFDYLDFAATSGGTVNSTNGRIYFSVLEPFGSYLRKKVFADSPEMADKYAYDSLYTLTKSGAEQFPEKNKFLLEGSYKSQSGSEINLNALNVPQGSVKVTAGGGVPLVENVDYTVDYTLGRVRIINESILSSGSPINISLESNSMFNMQQKRMMGLRVDHEVNKDFHLGATLLNLHERPLTQKVNYGDDPINNTIYGLDLNYHIDSRWLTKVLDKLPGFSSKDVSKVNIDGEFAHFLPGHSKSVGKSGTSYIDDFEGAKSTIDLRQISTWFLASTPQGQPDLFPEASIGTGLEYGKNRAKLAWYIIDQSIFYDRNGNLRPSNVDKTEVENNNNVRQVYESEVYPNKAPQNGIDVNIAVLNLAYYPEERGPYNYDVNPTSHSNGLTENGLLNDPASRWGGIMRRIESTDFEATNIEYIEFWMMDPFADDQNNSGELIFNLGDISEDILRDGRKSYENGLPISASVIEVDTSIWGRVPTVQSMVESFSNEAGARQYQDVGYDGLGDADEISFHTSNFLDIIEQKYSLQSEAFNEAYADPSADNFHYFRGSDYDNNSKYSSVLERYKNYNGPEGNSATDEQNNESYTTSATSIPNIEDINRDNTLSETERYFQYRVKLDPAKMNVGENFISSTQTGKGGITWYQFRIPLSQPEKVVGNIEDFRSVRFIRMFLRGFEKPVVTRFATLELVRGEWRKYKQNLQAPGEYIPNDAGNETNFDISAVNIDENGRREPINYNTPPGIEQELNFATTTTTRMNEQSMQITIENLMDGDARAAYKTTEFDFRQYKKLKMYVHAEKRYEDQVVVDGELRAFIRVGADFTENYYEYEIPLKFSLYGDNSREGIWPEENNFNIDLDELVRVKQNRNHAMLDPNSTVRLNYPYTEQSGDRVIKVIGSPSISDIKGIMIGIRNPKQQNIGGNDDGLAKNAIIWVNELRVSDFKDQGGWAATARVETILANLGRVVVTGSHKSPGFGTLDMSVNETVRESITNFDIATDIDFGKFLPETAGIRLPVHFDYGETHANPEYNPVDPDITMKSEYQTLDNQHQIDSLKSVSNDYTLRKNINLVNVRKDRVASDKTARIYDVENFNVSYSFSELYHRNIDLEYDLRQTYRGGLGYNFSVSPKNVTPFASIKWMSKPYLQLIKDFNFFYLPKNFSFRTDMNRQKNEKKYRNKSEGDIITYPIYARQWDWNRNFDFKFDLTKSLTFDFTAGVNAYVYEPAGNPDKSNPDFTKNRDTIMDEIMSFGTKTRYNQTVRLNYTLPFSKIRLLDWVNVSAGYQGMYTWIASPVSIQESLGNAIENQNSKMLNGNLDMLKLYNKIGYLKKLNTSKKGGNKGGPVPRPGMPKDKEGSLEEIPVENDSIDKKPAINYFKLVADGVLKLAMSVKKGNLSFTQNNGIYLPGFKPEPDIFGINLVNSSPGLGFVLGSEADIRNLAIRNDWLSSDSNQNQAYAKKLTETMSYKINLEPVPGLRIDFNGDRTSASNFSEYYRLSSSGDSLNTYSPTTSGNFSMSYWLWKTAFVKSGKEESSELFDNLLTNRRIIANRLAYSNPQWVAEGETYTYDSLGGDFFPSGYRAMSPEVVMYSFIASYSGKTAESINLSPFPKIPFPNWSVNYNGLTKIASVARLFKTVNLTHTYRSSYSINTWRTNVDYDPTDLTKTYKNSNFYISKFDIGMISITEQFSPLLGIDVGLQNSLTARVEYKKQRNLTMSFINNQLTEVNSTEFVIGTGYRIRNLSLIISSVTGGKSSKTTNDLVFKVDVGFRNDKTTLRRIAEQNSKISSGQKKINIYVTADYMLSSKFNLQAFFKRDVSDPYMSNQYKNSNTFAGITMRFNLAQ
ncbi:MAG: cell surface protein SprA [Bacteroidales bacterium]|nr:cell surface protein SprA [Bacteroidales bacterium]